VTWWDLGGAWLAYLARCQLLLRQGRFVADFCCFYGEDAPNFVPARAHNDPPLPPGFDCDTLNAEVLLHRLSVRAGRLTLPDGLGYRYLVLPHRKHLAMSPPVLRRLKQLVEAGATVIGPPPQHAPGLSNWPQCDAEVRALARALWGPSPAPAGERKLGRGRLIWGRPLADIAAADRLPPDVEFRDLVPASIPPRFDGVSVPLDWIHRRDGETDFYFIANIGDRAASAQAVLRAAGRAPELWDPLTGQVRPLPEFALENGRSLVPLVFAPKQSFFVVLRPAPRAKQPSPASAAPPARPENFPALETVAALAGSWQVAFATNRGGPGAVTFDTLEDWTRRPEAGIRFYSGVATYRQTFDLPPAALPTPPARLFLDLGKVKNLACVRLNGKDLGVVWTAPWRVDITACARPGGNELAIDVVNLWPNRLIGDAALPPEQRRTTTNVRKFAQPGLPLLASGLLGPVTLQRETR
jgi:hypothetical protein